MASKTYQIAILPGDGIGPEIMEQAMRVLDRVSEKSSSVKLQMKSVRASSNIVRLWRSSHRLDG